ncbi:MAG: ribosome biogenesis GTP-binding protein YihA/YsxC [Bdellovibrionales bacterium]|nr:ribosome biogenesis GTP-binding protein YihA/YsxC [Bdellovibrionales bacterium]
MSKVQFVKSAGHWSQFPEGKMPQVAIAGRSNSGKSSFINGLARSKIAKVSGTPGKTRLLNIFDVEKKFWLVDMPGYGYAARSHKERGDWEKMIEEYLLNSEQLRGLILLMDIRRKWGEEENVLLDFCTASDLNLVVGLTKGDKLSRSRWKSRQMEMEKQLGVPCYALSSLKNWGIRDVTGHVLREWI